MAQSAYYPDVLVKYLSWFHDAKVQKNPHLIIISEEIFLVNEIEQVSHLQRIGYGVQDAIFCIVTLQCYRFSCCTAVDDERCIA